jgi:parallel beta-helix repeat protein
MEPLTSTIIFVPENYTSIREAINAANPEDTIFVNNGTYYENISINKTITLIGKSPTTTIIDGSTANSSTVWVYGTNVRDVVISNFTIKGSLNSWGLYLLGATNTTIENNIISNNHGGVLADASDDGTFVNNTISGNTYEGLFFFQSSGNTMRNNTLYENLYNFGIQESAFDDDIDKSNFLDEKHIYILRNQIGITIDPNAYPDMGYLALINCSDLTIENLNLTNNLSGIVLAQTNNTILTNNTLANNWIGISVYDSTNNTLQDNNITNNGQGITLANSPNNTFKNNNLTANQQHIIISGGELTHFLQDMDMSNTVDAKLVHYITNQTGLTITQNTFPNTGYLALVNCQNITVQNLTMQNNILLIAFSLDTTIWQNTISKGGISLQNVSYSNISANTLTDGDSAISMSNSCNNTVRMNNVTQNNNHGIFLESSTGNLIINNSVAENKIGIELDASASNAIVGNNVAANEEYGIFLTNSNHNVIYHNNFINNAMPRWQAVCGNIPSIADNVWDNGYPSGGNYWSDYDGADQESGTKQNATGCDAIGDISYDINFGQRDHYPLIGPYHDFTVMTGQEYHIEIVSNSSIANLNIATWLSSPTPYLQPGQQFLQFFVAGEANTTGFCRTTVPRSLLNGTNVVLVDGLQTPATELVESNITHAYIYFTYGQSEHEIVIVPEYPMIASLIIMTFAISIITTMKAKKTRKTKTETCATSTFQDYST